MKTRYTNKSYNHLLSSLVFGASGLTAQECIYQALKDGDTVVGLTRNPSNVVVPKGSGGADAEKAMTDPNLTVIAGKKLYALDICVCTRYCKYLVHKICTRYCKYPRLFSHNLGIRISTNQ